MTNSNGPNVGVFSWLHTEKAEYVRSALAEFVGTAILVLFTCGTCVATGTKADTLVSTALSFGFTVACLVACLGHVSGCHINPAVTVGMLVNGQCNLVRALIYIIAQLLGGVAGAAVLYGILLEKGSGGLCATTLDPKISVGQGIAVEMFICCVLILVICNVCESNSNMAPLLIGLAVTAGHLFAIPLTSSSMNTARSFGPAVIAGKWDNHEVYWIGPLLGGALGGFLHRFIFCNKSLYEKVDTSNQNNEPANVTTAI